MKLDIPHPESIDFPHAYGISPELQGILSRHLDSMVGKWGTEPIMVRTTTIVQDIAAFCDGPEEFAYCIILHMGWQQRRGFQLAPRGNVAENTQGEKVFLISLTRADIGHLESSGLVQVNPKDAG